MLAHAGIGLSVIGIVATSAWQSESVVAMKPGDRTEIAGYELTFRGVAPSQGANYKEQVGLLAVSRGGAAVTELTPSKRIYDAPRQATTEAAIHVAISGDLYAVLGDEMTDGSGFVVRLYFNPLVRLWLGAPLRSAAPSPSPTVAAHRRTRRARRSVPSPAE
jgi:cytochrome c-type biogenesis protein CcmF